MSESSAEETTTADTETAGSKAEAPEAPTESQETDWVAEARKWEKRAKENASRLKDAEPKLSEYDKLVEASKSELERAQDTAQKAQARIDALAQRAVAADLRAALTGVVPDPSAVIEDLNIARFMGEDGEVDAAAIASLREKYLGLAPGKRTPAPNPAQGTSASGPSTASQLTEQDVQRLYREKKFDVIEKARQDGRLTTLLGG